MRWQSVARVVVGLAGLGVAVLVYLQLEDRQSVPGSVEVPLSDPDVVSTSRKGERLVLSAEGQPNVVIAYAEQRILADGRIEFSDVSAEFSKGGVTRTIQARTAVASGRAGPTGEQPARIDFSGNVRLGAADGISVETDDEATFFNQEQKTVIPGRMRFTRGRLSGGGVGAELFMESSILWINEDAMLRVAPEREGGAAVEARARRIGLADADHFMRLEGDAVMTYQAQRLSADTARVMFTPATYGVQFIELRGRSRVTATAGAGTRPDLSAGDINLAFAEGTGLLSSATLAHDARVQTRSGPGVSSVTGSVIEMFLAPNGETLTRLQASAPVAVTLPPADGQPAKVIRSQGLQADGTEAAGLTRAVFSGGVQYEETRGAARGRATPALRTATSETLTLDLAGSLTAVERAQFLRTVRVVDGTLTATAGAGTYDSAAETLALRSPAGTARPKVATGDMDVVATLIDADLKGDGLDARGQGDARVESTLKPSTGTTSASSAEGLFERGKVITGVSDRLVYSRASGRATYEGGVYLLQGDSHLAADRVVLDEGTGDVTATGSVKSALVLDTRPSRVSADALTYTERTRVADYSGRAVLEAPSGERTTGDRVVLTLKPEGRALSGVIATATGTNVVRVTLPGQRQATGREVTYDAETDRYRVTGEPATFVLPSSGKETGECTLLTGTELRFSRTSGAAEVVGRGGALGTTQTVKCAEVIK